MAMFYLIHKLSRTWSHSTSIIITITFHWYQPCRQQYCSYQWLGYRLEKQEAQLNSQQRKETFSPFQIVHVNSGAYLAYHSMISAVLFLSSWWPGCEAYHSTPPNAEAKNEWSYASIPPRCLHGIHQDRLYFTFNVTLTFSFLGMPQQCTSFCFLPLNNYPQCCPRQ